jgi:predicted ester cyclase
MVRTGWHRPAAATRRFGDANSVASLRPGKNVETKHGSQTLISGTITAFPDVHYTIDTTITDGDLVAFIWRAEGTNTGSLQGRPPTSKHAAWTGINAFRVQCGQIVEVWAEIDALGRLRQLGLAGTPTP